MNFRLEDMKDQLRKRMFTKRIVKRLKFTIVNGISIELNSYALICPTVRGRNFTSLSNLQKLLFCIIHFLCTVFLFYFALCNLCKILHWSLKFLTWKFILYALSAYRSYCFCIFHFRCSSVLLWPVGPVQSFPLVTF